MLALKNEHLKNQLSRSLAGVDYLITEEMEAYKRLKEFDIYSSSLRHQPVDRKGNMMDLVETLIFIRDCYSLKVQIIVEAKDNESEQSNEFKLCIKCGTALSSACSKCGRTNPTLE